MKLFYGSYPSLEKSFLQVVASSRKSILEKWLIVCSSSLVADELQTQLAAKLGALANIHFITLGGLISRLDVENGQNALPLFPQDNLRSFLIKELLQRPGLDRYPVSDGFVETVKSSLRDMADSLVDPAVFEEHIASLPDCILQEEGDRLFWIAHLYRAYLEAEQKIPGYRTYQNAFENALSQVEKSAYLQSFKQIILYGFYDMSGRQLDVVQRLRQTYPVTVFAPYQKHPAFQFAEKFFETNWLITPDVTAVDTPPQTDLQKSVNCLFVPGQSAPCEALKIVSAADTSGEVFFAAKEILRLTQTEQYAFSDIGIIARTTTPYQAVLTQAFAENKIPLNASFTYPLSRYSLGRFCVNLLSLASYGFEREAVLKIVSSPYFKHPQKQTWLSVIRRSLVSRDLHQWQDLLPQTKGYDPSLLVWLEQLAAQLSALDTPQPWQDGAAKVLALLKNIIDETAFEDKDREVFEAVCHAIEKIGLYHLIRAQAKEGELLKEVQTALKNLSFHEAFSAQNGVTFTDAVRARGLCFKVVFILGLNDQMFPLVTPEDPVLRDFYRYMLRDVLGYWINQSLVRGQEEKLLFFASVCAATEKLYVVYQRLNNDGKPAVASIYLAELMRAAQVKPEACVRVSGRLSEQLSSVSGTLLTPKEISYLAALHPREALSYYKQAGLLTSDKQTALEAASYQNQLGALNAYDGVIESGADFFNRMNEKGFSASALQRLAGCPLRYFFEKGLNLAEPDDLLDRSHLAANTQGTIFHEILSEFYNYLYEHHLTHDLFDSGAQAFLNQLIEARYTKDGYRLFGIYPLVWELLVENMRAKLTDFVVQDLKQLGPFTPSRFEQAVALPPTQELPIRLQGIIDRIDLDEQTRSFLIADYKSSRKGTKDLAADFFHLLVFQPFIYVFIAQHLDAFKNYTSAGSCLLSIEPKYARRLLTAPEYEAMRVRAVAFLKQITDLIKQGTLVMCPSEKQCAYCAYTTVCKRDSFKSLQRARKSAVSRALEEARQ